MFATPDPPTRESAAGNPPLRAVIARMANRPTPTSTHEAGHGVLAVLLGVRFTDLRAFGDGSGELRPSTEQVMARAGNDDATIAADILVSAGGPAAEALVYHGDWRRAVGCASRGDREGVRVGREALADRHPHHPLSPCTYVDALSIIIQPGVTAAIMDTAKLLAALGTVTEKTVAHIVAECVERYDPDHAEVRLANVRRLLASAAG